MLNGVNKNIKHQNSQLKLYEDIKIVTDGAVKNFTLDDLTVAFTGSRQGLTMLFDRVSRDINQYALKYKNRSYSDVEYEARNRSRIEEVTFYRALDNDIQEEDFFVTIRFKKRLKGKLLPNDLLEEAQLKLHTDFYASKNTLVMKFFSTNLSSIAEGIGRHNDYQFMNSRAYIDS